MPVDFPQAVDPMPMGRTRSRPPDAMSRLVTGGVAAPWPWLYVKAEESEIEADTTRRMADAASDLGAFEKDGIGPVGVRADQ